VKTTTDSYHWYTDAWLGYDSRVVPVTYAHLSTCRHYYRLCLVTSDLSGRACTSQVVDILTIDCYSI